MRNDEQKDHFEITRDSLIDLGIDPETVIDKIEKVRAKDLTPVIVSGYFLLKGNLISS